jgi:hypothetical protein
MGNGFIAAHVWREVGQPELASRNWRTYSFIPNLLWLPAQVAKLTDREASFAQEVIQRLSYRIYGSVELSAELQGVVKPIWDRLTSNEQLDERLDLSTINFFDVPEVWFEKRHKDLTAVVDALQNVMDGQLQTKKILSTRFTEGIARLQPEAVRPHLEELRAYAKIVGPRPL